VISFTDATLKPVAESLLNALNDGVAETLNELIELPKQKNVRKYGDLQGILLRLQEQYTGFDNGNLIAVLCVNFLTLHAGDSAYIPTDAMYAYLFGVIVECMARSGKCPQYRILPSIPDPVLNTGSCPRPKRDWVD
jgi:mannose-6-phosphate isomerase